LDSLNSGGLTCKQRAEIDFFDPALPGKLSIKFRFAKTQGLFAYGNLAIVTCEKQPFEVKAS